MDALFARTMKAVSWVVLVVLAIGGCASTGGVGYVKPDVTDAQRDADAKECAHPGMLIGGALTMPLLIFPGVALIAAGASMERSCMKKKGYVMQEPA